MPYFYRSPCYFNITLYKLYLKKSRCLPENFAKFLRIPIFREHFLILLHYTAAFLIHIKPLIFSTPFENIRKPEVCQCF